MERRRDYVVPNFSTIASQSDVATSAQQQLPVLREFDEKTESMEGAEDFRRYYLANAPGMTRLLERT